ncbi:MAG TPA: carbohydrate ABC transporter permease [Phycisphaerae bacterium]|nr:carbohydrate ABC transporter permease [Phycisphaerae bacterium]
MSANPLRRSRWYCHLPLIVLSVVFAVPFAWLTCSSLQPREQVGSIPPQWLPRMHYARIGSEDVAVTKPVAVGVDSVVVVPQSGPDKGKKVLAEARHYAPGPGEGMLTQPVQQSDAIVTVKVPARLVQRVPADWVRVEQWSVSKYVKAGQPEWYCLPPEAVRSATEPVWRNYPEAVRALTAEEKDKALPLGKLLAKSRLPWTHPRAPGRTITFLTYVVNTLVVAVLGVIGTVLSSSLVAYGLSRIPWRGRRVLFWLTVSTMMIPFPVLMVPLYSVFRALGWIGTLLPLWVPACFGGAFNIFLLRQFFMTIPRELSEAARVDGCSEFGIYWRIVLPLAKPALAVVALFHFLYAWNDFLAPLIFLTRPETYTIALGLQQYQSQHGGSEWHLLMAASALLVLPIVVLFFLTQRTFIQGIATTGTKG